MNDTYLRDILILNKNNNFSFILDHLQLNGTIFVKVRVLKLKMYEKLEH